MSDARLLDDELARAESAGEMTAGLVAALARRRSMMRPDAARHRSGWALLHDVATWNRGATPEQVRVFGDAVRAGGARPTPETLGAIRLEMVTSGLNAADEQMRVITDAVRAWKTYPPEET